jgi:hypothetical protein
MPASIEHLLETIARVCHETNRAYCDSLGDHSQLPWSEAPEWQRESCRDGVLYRLDHPEASPREMHQQWLARRREEGWSYGPTKDAEKKTHPCFIPYEELPRAQQRKDALFSAVVDTLRA